MCQVLQLPRSTFYYEAKHRTHEDDITSHIVRIFHESRQNYGTRKIKHELIKLGKAVSRRRIGRIMKELGLVSKYTVAQFKPHSEKPNEDQYSNELNRKFTRNEAFSVVVSDLTYVRVDKKWHYICGFAVQMIYLHGSVIPFTPTLPTHVSPTHVTSIFVTFSNEYITLSLAESTIIVCSIPFAVNFTVAVPPSS